MSYNTQHCLNFITREIDFDIIADTIKKCEADIIGLQEIRDEGQDADYQSQAKIIAEKLGYQYYYFAEAIRVGGVNPYGNAIISRYPIISAETIRIPDPKTKKYDGHYESRCILKARIDAGNGLDVFVSHFGLNPDEQENAVETVVLNAANMGFGDDPAKGMDLFTCDIKEFQGVFETNNVWNFMIIREAALRMREAGKGTIVFIGSNTSYRAIPNRTAYIASKGGINAMSKALAVDLGPFGIRSNVVLPGTIKTQRWVEMGSKQIVNGEMTPIGDISEFEDIANAAWFLGSDESKNITGAEIMLDGGMSAQLFPERLKFYKSAYMEREDERGKS